MKKVLYAIGLALLTVSCTEDYTDWANPFKNDPEAAKSMSMSISPVATIDLATVTTETIQIFSPSIAIDDEAGYLRLAAKGHEPVLGTLLGLQAMHRHCDVVRLHIVENLAAVGAEVAIVELEFARVCHGLSLGCLPHCAEFIVHQNGSANPGG